LIVQLIPSQSFSYELGRAGKRFLMPANAPSNSRTSGLKSFELFHRQGYGATGIAQILKEAEVNSGSLYYYFPTKEDLLVAVLQWCKENLWPEIIQPVFDRVSDPIERIFGVLDGYRQMLILTSCTHGCPMGNFTLELADSHPRYSRLGRGKLYGLDESDRTLLGRRLRTLSRTSQPRKTCSVCLNDDGGWSDVGTSLSIARALRRGRNTTALLL
jgi:hypothetical protein